MVCLHCGKKLSVVKKLTTGEFCSAAHKKAYLQEQERFALARLLENQQRLGGKSPDVGGRPAARKPGKTKGRGTENETPVEGAYLSEQVHASTGPRYLAIPEVQAEMNVRPLFPEHEPGVERTHRPVMNEGEAEMPVAKALPEEGESETPWVEMPNSGYGEVELPPGWGVKHRYGLAAIFPAGDAEGLTADEVPVPVMAANPEFSLADVFPASGGESAFPSGQSAVLPGGLTELSGDWRAGDGGLGIDWAQLDWERLAEVLGNVDAAMESEGGALEPVAIEAGIQHPQLEAASFGLPAARTELQEAAESWVCFAGQLGLGDATDIRAASVASANPPECPAAFSNLSWAAASVEVPSFSPARPAPQVGQGDLKTVDRGVAAIRLGDDGFRLAAIQEIAPSSGFFCMPSGLAGGRMGRAEFDEATELIGQAVPAPESRRPRPPYPLDHYQSAFAPAPLVAAMSANLVPRFGPRVETRLVALELPLTTGVAPKGMLRANSEGSFGLPALFLPKQKHTIRPAAEHHSVFSALGHLTAGNRDFSLQGINRRWSRLPNDLRWVAMAVPLVLGLIWYSSLPATSGESDAVVAEGAEPGVLSKVFGDDSMLELKRTIQKRAAVELSDDFRQGLGEWSGVGDWASGWRYDRAGFLRPRQMAFYTPSLELVDYRFEFLGQIERKALSWVFRAADPKNYYVNRLEITDPAPLPEVVLVRYAVVNGRAGTRKVTRLPMQTHLDTLYRVRVDVSGPNFVTTIQGQVVDVFSDERISRGGVGFFALPGEDVRLRWVEVSHQYDFLGRLCAFLVPYNVSNNTMRSGQ